MKYFTSVMDSKVTKANIKTVGVKKSKVVLAKIYFKFDIDIRKLEHN